MRGRLPLPSDFVNTAIAEVAFHDGRRLELRHSKHACAQRHAGGGMGKGFLTMISDAVGAPVLTIGAMEGSSLQNAACCIALRTNGHVKNMPCLCEDAYRYPMADIMAKFSRQFRSMTNQVLGYLALNESWVVSMCIGGE